MSQCKKTWMKCKNVELVSYHAVFVNGNCPHGIDNDRGDYFVFKSTCDTCKSIDAKESEGKQMAYRWCELYGCFLDDVEEIVEEPTCDMICEECEECSEVMEGGRLRPIKESDDEGYLIFDESEGEE